MSSTEAAPLDGVRRPAPILSARSRARLRLVPWWAWTLAIYVASRLVTTLILAVFAANQEPNSWTGASPSVLDFSSMWDGRWYQIIAIAGYPSELPITDAGTVGENAWAFMPVYPAIVSAVMFATGFTWSAAAVFVSLAAGAGCALLFTRLMRRFLDGRGALVAGALLCFSPLSPLFQLAYAEALGFLLLTLALTLLVERRYGWLVPVVLVMGFTRPTGLAFALALAFHLVARWWVRRDEPFPVRERMLVAGLVVWSGLVGLAWPGIAWLVTGSLTAYTDTELAWRSAYIGSQHLVPFAAWFQGGTWWANWWGWPAWLGPVIVVALILVFLLIVTSRRVGVIGIDLRLWVAAYGIYLLAVFFPQSSTFRLLAPMFPLLGALAAPRSPWFRVLLLFASVAGQIVWIEYCWRVDGADWTPP